MNFTFFQNSAILKRNVWKYIASGKKATTAKEFSLALVGLNPVANTLVLCGKIMNKPAKSKERKQIPGVTKYKDFLFCTNGIIARSFSGIGPNGKKIKLERTSKFNVTYECDFVLPGSSGHRIVSYAKSTQMDCIPQKHTNRDYHASGTVTLVKGTFGDFDDSSDSTGTLVENSMFLCPNQQCNARFRTNRWYQHHLQGGKCYVQLRSESIEGHLKRMWFSKFSNNLDSLSAILPNQDNRYLATFFSAIHAPKIPVGLVRKPTEIEESPVEGFALYVRPKVVRFSETQLSFVRTIFNQGQEDGKKATPAQTVWQMKTYRRNGKLLFKPKERLDEDQVKALFGRFFAEVKSQKQGKPAENKPIDGEEIISAEEADEFDSYEDLEAVNSILKDLDAPESLGIRHPIKVSLESRKYVIFVCASI